MCEIFETECTAAGVSDCKRAYLKGQFPRSEYHQFRPLICIKLILADISLSPVSPAHAHREVCSIQSSQPAVSYVLICAS